MVLPAFRVLLAVRACSAGRTCGRLWSRRGCGRLWLRSRLS